MGLPFAAMLVAGSLDPTGYVNVIDQRQKT
jgi:hypothetical protein